MILPPDQARVVIECGKRRPCYLIAEPAAYTRALGSLFCAAVTFQPCADS